MLAEITAEELSAALDAVAMEVLDSAGVSGPPVDAMQLARGLGIDVAEDDRQQGRARCVRLEARRGRGQRSAILLRPEPRDERRQWATAHEIGEQVAWQVFRRLGIGPEEAQPKTREEAANLLAGRILVPTAWFHADAAEAEWDLLALKARYRTASHELIARRMLELPVPAILTIFDQGRIYFRRSNVRGRVPPPSPAEVRCWQVVHERGRPEVSYDGPQAVRGWPIHEPGWKREILHTEVDLDLA